MGSVPILALGLVSLALGIAGGLARVSPIDAPVMALAFHGPLMVSSFLGTVVSLERAVALGRPWAYGAPLLAGASGIALLAGQAITGMALMALAALVFLAATLALLQRRLSLETATLAAGAAAWLAGNFMLFEGQAAVPWWMAFFALTIGAERLELSRTVKRPPAARRAFAVLAIALVVSPLYPPALGAVLFLLALWLGAFDIARATVREAGLARYVAACLLAGYFWLAIGGVLVAASMAYDAALHAVFIGFVFSMIFGHAPAIVPAVLRLRFPYSPFLYLPLLLLHGSLAVRAALSTSVGAWGNAAAIALFAAAAAALVIRASSGRPTPTAPGP